MPKRKNRPALVGQRFTGTYRGRSYEVQVVRDKGSIRYSVNGRSYASPSGAAKSITKHEVNGWKFWGMD